LTQLLVLPLMRAHSYCNARSLLLPQ
jgi:hypothetical protein